MSRAVSVTRSGFSCCKNGSKIRRTSKVLRLGTQTQKDAGSRKGPERCSDDRLHRTCSAEEETSLRRPSVLPGARAAFPKRPRAGRQSHQSWWRPRASAKTRVQAQTEGLTACGLAVWGAPGPSACGGPSQVRLGGLVPQSKVAAHTAAGRRGGGWGPVRRTREPRGRGRPCPSRRRPELQNERRVSPRRCRGHCLRPRRRPPHHRARVVGAQGLLWTSREPQQPPPGGGRGTGWPAGGTGSPGPGTAAPAGSPRCVWGRRADTGASPPRRVRPQNEGRGRRCSQRADPEKRLRPRHEGR